MSPRSPRPGVTLVYELPEASDGTRMLVDCIWSRGLTKEHASVDVWLKDIAPSAGLRTAFGHDPNRWREFQERYFEELRANHAAVEHLTDLVSTGKVTLLFGAHDTERNNAVALADYLGPRRPQRHLYGLVADYPRRGGRMFRPSLCIASARVFGAAIDDAVRSAAALSPT